MKFIKYIAAWYLILFFFSFQIIHTSGLFDKYHKINIPVKNFPNAFQNKNVDIDNDDECPFCRFIASNTFFISIDYPVFEINSIFRENEKIKTFPKIVFYSNLNNRSPPIVL